MNNKTTNVRYLAQLALLAAIEVVMKLMGLGSVPVGPLYMSFLTVPIAVGAMTMGPTAGAILGGVFGLVSMKDAITGVSAMTSVFFQISPINTFVLCVVMRVLMGWCVGLLFCVLRRMAGFVAGYADCRYRAAAVNAVGKSYHVITRVIMVV